VIHSQHLSTMLKTPEAEILKMATTDKQKITLGQ